MKWWNRILEKRRAGAAALDKTNEPNDAEVLQLVRESLLAEADLFNRFDERKMLAAVKAHAVLEAYLRGEASPAVWS